MAKTKHQKLADHMQAILDVIENNMAAVARNLNLVQFHLDMGIIPAEERKNLLLRGAAQALLYCAIDEEFSNEIDWFESEMATDSIACQFRSIMEYEYYQAILRDNLVKNAEPIWFKAQQQWQTAAQTSPNNPDYFYTTTKQPQKIDELDFSAQDGQSLAFAYEAVLKSVKTRTYRHRLGLLLTYKRCLEEALFDGILWNKDRQKAFLLEWKNTLFSNHKPIRSHAKTGRWKQCEAIDYVTAAKFIRYFVDQFIANPSDLKMGEVACVLWLLIWVAKESDARLTLEQVLQISSQDIDPSSADIAIGDSVLEVSWGLHNLLICLRGQGRGERKCRLFANLDGDGKALTRALQEASKALIAEGKTPVSPAAFLIFPHVYEGIRLPEAQLKAMRSSGQAIRPYLGRSEIKRAILDSVSSDR